MQAVGSYEGGRMLFLAFGTGVGSALIADHVLGPEMLCYMLSHEAHHRGQVCMLAHQLGFPLPKEVAYGIWNWEKLWKECGSPGGPGYDS